jgi:hypothetical protein
VPTRDERNAYQRDYYARNKERFQKYYRDRECTEERREYQRKHRKEYARRLKNQVLEAYGSCCVCCGETNPGFLSIDHVNGGGREHRRSVGGGVMLYLDIIRRGFPAEFQIQCFNCNLGRNLNGGICPHVEAEVAAAS